MRGVTFRNRHSTHGSFICVNRSRDGISVLSSVLPGIVDLKADGRHFLVVIDVDDRRIAAVGILIGNGRWGRTVPGAQGIALVVVRFSLGCMRACIDRIATF